MKKLSLLIHVLLFFIVTSCNEKSTNELNKSSLEKEVRNMFKAYDDSVRKNGIEAEFAFLDKSDQFYWVPPGYKYALHYDSIATLLHEYAPNFSYIDNTWDTLQIMVLTETYASFNGIINSYAITSTNDTTTTKLSETGLVIKRGEHWKFLSGQTVVLENE